MKCKECGCAKKGWFKSKPDDYVCIGVNEPFIISDINNECTEYPEKRNKKIESDIVDAIVHFKYGISNDIFKEPVTNYAKMAIEALGKRIPIEHHHSKVLEIHDKARISVCPNCLGMIITEAEEFPKFCTCCGQAIDWEK